MEMAALGQPGDLLDLDGPDNDTCGGQSPQHLEDLDDAYARV